jgi:hypothetical protein
MIGLYAAIEAGGTHVHTIKGRAEAWSIMEECDTLQSHLGRTMAVPHFHHIAGLSSLLSHVFVASMDWWQQSRASELC